MKTAYALAFLGLLALLSPAAGARRLLQDSTTITDSDILNFALNLEVSKSLQFLLWQISCSHSCLSCSCTDFSVADRMLHNATKRLTA